MEKQIHEILAALQYKPLYNISHIEKWGKKNTSRDIKLRAYGKSLKLFDFYKSNFDFKKIFVFIVKHVRLAKLLN